MASATRVIHERHEGKAFPDLKHALVERERWRVHRWDERLAMPSQLGNPSAKLFHLSLDALPFGARSLLILLQALLFLLPLVHRLVNGIHGVQNRFF